MSVIVLDGVTAVSSIGRPGIVRADHHVLADDAGVFHPLGLTFFWALYGWQYERDRIHEHLKWIATKGFDYLRILGECDWAGRSWSPAEFPDYDQVLREFVDCAYDQYGLRSQITIVGGQQFNQDGTPRFVPTELARQVAAALGPERAHKVILFEMANEADNGSSGWANKVTNEDLVDMGIVVGGLMPNLVALSCPVPDHFDDMKALTHAADADAYTPHPRRSSHDEGWSHVRQGYDFKDYDRATFNNEPEGPQSSVHSMDNPLQFACTRLLGIVCGGAGYVLHVAQGVTGEADPNHGRPQNMWEVPHIDACMAAVRGVDALIPEGVENWKVVNNARDDHPMPLDPDKGFWEGSHPGPAVNKNYAALAPDGVRFVVIVTAVKSAGVTGLVTVGQAIRRMAVEAFNPETCARVASTTLEAGQAWQLEGRGDTMTAYLIQGRYV